MSVNYPALIQTVRRQFHLYAVSRHYFYVMHPHLARNMTQNHVFVVELDLKRRVWQRLDDVAVDLYDVVFCHLTPFC